MKKKSIIIKGYYGRDNLGDELMMDVFANFFQKNYGEEVDLFIMNSAPMRVKQKYSLDTPSELITGGRGKNNLLHRVKTICLSDLYVIGGGTILTDKHGVTCMLEYWIETLIRKILQKKTIIVSIGSTDFQSKIGRFACKRILNHVTCCMVRDDISYTQLKELCSKDSIIKTGDIVSLAVGGHTKKNNTFQLKKVVFCVMPYYKSIGDDSQKDELLAIQLAQIIGELKKNGLIVDLLPIQYGYENQLDLNFSELVGSICEQKINIRKIEDSQEKVCALTEYDLIISMRLHALLVGLMNNVNVIAIDHNPKITALMNLFNKSDYSCSLEQIKDILFMVSNITEPSINDSVASKEIYNAKKNFYQIEAIMDEILQR